MPNKHSKDKGFVEPKNTSQHVSLLQLKTGSDDQDLRCGYGRFKPRWLQKCNNSKGLLVVVCWFVMVQSFIVSGLVNVNTATLERRFELSSSQVAWISSAYDVSGGVLSCVFGYVSTFVNKPRMMAINGAVMAVGTFLMVLPHLIVEPYELGNKVMDICGQVDNSTQCDSSSELTKPDLSKFVYILILGQALHGFGGAAVYVVGTPLLDESVGVRDSPLYIGIMQGMSALGPAFGFLLGGWMLHYYVDLDKVDVSKIDVTPSDPRWVGAWWVGFAIGAIGGITVVFLMGCFARELPATEGHRRARISEAYGGHGESDTDYKQLTWSWSDVLKSLSIIFSNPTWICITIGATLEAGTIQALGTFLPKILQFQFALSPGKAALITGALVVPGAAIGQVLGGLIPKWLNSKVKGLTLQCAISCGTSLLLCFVFIFKCDMQRIAGVTMEYPISVNRTALQLEHPCNTECGCTTRSYEPVCGVDGIQYFSACHAGCMHSHVSDDGSEIHMDCLCISRHINDTITDPTLTPGQHIEAVDGVCESDCTALYLFLPFTFVLCLVTFIANTSFLTITMRVVPIKQREFACGLKGTIVRFLGAVPFPIFFGMMLDSVCLVWQDTCAETGSCWIYDNNNLGRRLIILLVIVKSVSTTMFFLSYWVYKPPKTETVIIETVIESTTNATFLNVNHVTCIGQEEHETETGRGTETDSSQSAGSDQELLNSNKFNSQHETKL